MLRPPISTAGTVTHCPLMLISMCALVIARLRVSVALREPVCRRQELGSEDSEGEVGLDAVLVEASFGRLGESDTERIRKGEEPAQACHRLPRGRRRALPSTPWATRALGAAWDARPADL